MDPLEPLRLLCGQLAERAAHLEVLLALLAELMVGHVMLAATGTSRTAVADSSGCPWTRIGWVDEVMALLENSSSRSQSKSTSPETDADIGERVALASKDVAIQADIADRSMNSSRRTPSSKTAAVRYDEFGFRIYDELSAVTSLTSATAQATTQTEGRSVCRCGRPVRASGEEKEEQRDHSASQCCQTELCMQYVFSGSDIESIKESLHLQHCAPASVADMECQVEAPVSHIEVQACVTTTHVSLQVCARTVAAETQTGSGASVAVETQTDPIPAPKPGGLRERKLNADDAVQQLAMMREKLKLEREATGVLEDKLTAAGSTIQDLRQETVALRAEVVASMAEAAAARMRPATAEMGTQLKPELETVDVQTDPCAFYSHSWQPRPSSRTSGGIQHSCADAAAQTVKVQSKERGMQTPSERRNRQDACVGDEEPLSLALGAASLPQDGTGRWKDSFGHGMQVLAEQWRSKYEASEAERARLTKLLRSAGGGS
jgi:hypothetical protein